MTQKEFKEIVSTLTAIRDALLKGNELRRKLQAKYPDETVAMEGISESQRKQAEALGTEISDLWEMEVPK